MAALKKWKNIKWTLWLASSLGLVISTFGQSPHNLKFTKIPVANRVSGIDIAIFDAGFKGAEGFPWFQKIVSEGRLKGTYNLVNPKEGVYNYSDHGLKVLSIIEGDDSLFYGASPGANYYLFVTEDVFTESRKEESYWAQAFEMADSLGVDIINSSLSYTEFDDSTQNYTHEELDGKTALISKVARRALNKDILLISSSGNYANDPWNHIGFPADADSILTVGAIDSSGVITQFSSYGSTVDGRVKPEIVAVGQHSFCYHAERGFGTSSGTSFSAPVITGFAAQLLNFFPKSSKVEIWSAMLRSAQHYPNALEKYGYGVPNFDKAKQLLEKQELGKIQLYPNPVKPGGYLSLTTTGFKGVKILDSRGRLLFDSKLSDGAKIEIPAYVEAGLYVVILSDLNGNIVSRLIQVES
ncbi:S8 family peptidase [Luteibaculum oceani]|nr:S8 family peptidase [Luteibaculum oceani]